MRRIFSLMCVLALLTPLLPLSLFSLQVYATQNTYNGIQAANELDQFKRIPDSYPSYRVSGDDLDMMTARFAYVKFDDLPVQLYMAVDTELTANNGYILIHEQDVASWIAYYGQYSTDQFITHIKTITPKIRVMVGGVPEIFYNHAKIATYAGGSPGEFYFRQLPNGNWEPRVSGIQQYDTVYKHLIEMNMPNNAEVGEEVSISLRIRDGSVFLNQQQFWHLSVTKPDGREYLLHNHRVLPDSFTHEYQEIVHF
ncbi:hypothetical protein PRECH8_04520 [Insulibacter thermoxylanivorax]|uniref:Uncharacterized protein n=1 Tax=Insulibacter thermoxylanivorax TaxID=2749268 RepID=A0A916QES3_9BACL|nr:hypothetical protein [Insulibacter thermoxylanivorax]GFR37156.1 hypothetical protein PRECH8_04520 [Insulibacter thermoxylanivorax]